MNASAEASGRVTESTAFTSSARGRRRAEASSSSAVPPGHAPVEEQERCHLLEAGVPIRAT